MDVFDALHTTRAMRRLDTSREVSDEDIRKMVVAATKAPSGGNTQPVRWIVVKDSEKRKRLGEIYAKAFARLREIYDADPSRNLATAVRRSAEHLAEHMGESPVIIIPCAPSRPGIEGSVFPGIQNLMVAARALGLGTALTTVHRFYEDEVKEILGIPEEISTFAMIPVGYPLGRWGDAKRKPYEEVTYFDEWGIPAPG